MIFIYEKGKKVNNKIVLYKFKYILNIGRLGWVRWICESYDSNTTQPVVKKIHTPTQKPLKTDLTRRVVLVRLVFAGWWVECTTLPPSKTFSNTLATFVLGYCLYLMKYFMCLLFVWGYCHISNKILCELVFSLCASLHCVLLFFEKLC